MSNIQNWIKSVQSNPDKLKLILGAFIVPLAFYVILVSINKGIFEIDEIFHYLIVKYAFIDPTALLSPFGKPGFSIFAFLAVFITGDQFNIMPVRYMNCIISAFTCLFLALTLKLKNKSTSVAITGALLCMCAQVFYLSSISALSEPIAALILIASYYAYEKQQYILNALLLSFGFLCRPEFLIVMCIFGLIYLKKRNFKCILLFSVFGLIWVSFS